MGLAWGYLALAIGTDSFWLWYAGLSFLTLPVFGLYGALRCRHFVVALLFTVGMVVLVPMSFVSTLSFLLFRGEVRDIMWTVPRLLPHSLL